MCDVISMFSANPKRLSTLLLHQFQSAPMFIKQAWIDLGLLHIHAVAWELLN